MPRSTRIPLAALALVALAASMAPIFGARMLPLLDEPNHLSAAYVWNGLLDGDPTLERHYELSISPVSYFLHYGLTVASARLVGVELGHKLALAVYVLLFWAASFAWCRRMGRSPWLAFALGPLAFHQFWGLGFHPFDLGLALMLLGAAFADRFLERGDWRSALALLLSALACFLAHALPFAMLGLALLVLMVLWRPGARRAIALGACVLPALMLWRWQASVTHLGMAKIGRVLGGGANIDPFHWWRRFTLLPTHLGETIAGDLDVWRILLIALAVMAIAWFGDRDAARGEPVSLVGRRPLVLSLVFFALFFALPYHFRQPVYLWEAAGRFAVPAAFFLIVGLPASAPSSRSALPYAILVAMAIGWPGYLTYQYRVFDHDQGPLLRAVAEFEPGERVLTLSRQPREHPGFEPRVYDQLASRVQLLHGGFSPSVWQRPIPFPFRIHHRPPAPSWRAHGSVPPTTLASYDAVIVHHGGPFSRDWMEVWREGDWAIYRRH